MTTDDLWRERDYARIIGCQIRAGVPIQRNPEPITAHFTPGVNAVLSRLAHSVVDFVEVYRQYRAGGHNRRYAARIAHGIAFRGLSF
jgi:hypothetical protein